MRTHRGALLLRAGVVTALALGSLAVTATPALARDSNVEIRGLSPTTLGAGQSAQLQYRVSDGSEGVGLPNQIDIDVSTGELSCSGDCGSDLTFDPGEQKDFTATLKAPSNLAPGSSKKVTVTVSANGDGRDDSKSVEVTLRGPDKPDTIKSISGRVVNVATGRGISDAAVALNDGEHQYSTRTNDDGNFKFTSSDDNPISPGEIQLAAGKEGFQNNQTSTNVGAGKSKTGLRITLKSTAAPSPTATTASPTPAESTAPPSEVPSSAESIDPAIAGDNSGSDSGGGLFSWVLIILGGLLVALGVGAIVLLVIRRKEGGEDDTGDALPDPNGPRPTPGARGVYHGGPDPTMVAGGGAMGANPTMAMRPGLANAPTMMHRPVDEYGDPYGTPLRAPQPTSGPPPGGPQPGYGYPSANHGGYGAGGSPAAPMGPGSPGSPTAYGSASPTAYGGGPTGRASASVGPPDPYAPRDYDPPAPQPYGSTPHDAAPQPHAPAPAQPTASPGGYGYDEPTGRYDPSGGYGQAGAGYDQDRGGYDQDRGGYGQAGAGYGQAGAGNGYDSGYGAAPGNGYGRHDGGYAPGADSGYAPGANGGYDPGPANGGYGGDGYPAPSGYPPQGGYEGYGQQQGGYPPYDQGGQGGQGGYDQPAGYDRSPDQPQHGYDQGYYDEPPATRDDRGRRSSRRSLDWLDD